MVMKLMRSELGNTVGICDVVYAFVAFKKWPVSFNMSVNTSNQFD